MANSSTTDTQLEDYFEITTCIKLMDGCLDLPALQRVGVRIAKSNLGPADRDVLRAVYNECARAIRLYGGKYKPERPAPGMGWRHWASSGQKRALRTLGYVGDPEALTRDEAIGEMARLIGRRGGPHND